MMKIILLFIFLNTYLSQFLKSAIMKNILFITDIHLDVLYDSNATNESPVFCKNVKDFLNFNLNQNDYGRYDCDPPEHLLKILLTSAKNQNKIDLIVIIGDFIGHGINDIDLGDISINKRLLRATYQKIFTHIHNVFPDVPILPVIGNNDFLEHYQTPNSESKKEQTDFIRSLFFNSTVFKPELINKDFYQTTQHGLYYKISLLDVDFIVLNSNFYSLKNSNKKPEDSEKQNTWLEKQLKEIEQNDRKTFILFHIPLFPSFYNGTTSFMIEQDFIKYFENLAFKYKNNIIACLHGHNHWAKTSVRTKISEVSKIFTKSVSKANNNLRDFLMQKISKDNQTSHFLPTFNFPAVSPTYFNNPSYSILYFNNEEKNIVDIVSHHMNLKNTLHQDLKFSLNNFINVNDFWNIKYSYKKDFGFNSLESNEIYHFVNFRLKHDKKLYNLYSLSLGGFSNEDYYKHILIEKGMIDYVDQNNFICSLKILYERELNDCLKDR